MSSVSVPSTEEPYAPIYQELAVRTLGSRIEDPMVIALLHDFLRHRIVFLVDRAQAVAHAKGRKPSGLELGDLLLARDLYPSALDRRLSEHEYFVAMAKEVNEQPLAPLPSRRGILLPPSVLKC